MVQQVSTICHTCPKRAVTCVCVYYLPGTNSQPSLGQRPPCRLQQGWHEHIAGAAMRFHIQSSAVAACGCLRLTHVHVIQDGNEMV